MNKNLKSICEYLEQGLIERSEVVRLTLLAALSGEHMLLLGPPGTAKSQLARKLQSVFESQNYFERLLTRFSVPEELFGPLSIKALEEDRYHRLTKNYLPEASIAFIDEIFKANSAILNSLLTLLNEREFDNGSQRVQIPLISVVAASNELPEEEGLDALYDRFLMRYQVQTVSDAGFQSLLDLEQIDDYTDQFVSISQSDIESYQQLSRDISLSDTASQLIHALRSFLNENDIHISDRRWRKAYQLLKVSALTNEQNDVTEWDCALLLHMLWETPDQLSMLDNWYVEYLGLDIEPTITRLDKLVTTWEAHLADDKEKFTQKVNANGEYLYQTPEGEVTTQYEKVTLAERDGEVLYLAPQDQQDRTNEGKGYTLEELEKLFFDDNYKQTHIDGRWIDSQNYINNTQNRLVNRINYEPLVEPFYFSKEYIENQSKELIDISNEIEEMLQHYQGTINNLSHILEDHLWLKESVLETASNTMNTQYPKLVDYLQRMKSVHKLNASLKQKDIV